MDPKTISEMISEENVKEEMEKIGVCKEGIEIMLPKSKFRIIKLYDIRDVMCNILKQEMLSIGGDVAVNAGCVNCSVEKSDILIMGTVRQIRELVRKMSVQPSEAKTIAEQIENIIKEF